MNREESAQTKNIGDKKHSLKDLKNIVYKLAGVSTTKSLKLLQSDFKSLDFRRRSSWDIALKTISKTNSAKQFEDWRQNPPEEYKDLFSEIENVSKSYNQSIEAGLNISKSIKEDAKDLQKLSDEFSDEAGELNDDATTVEIKRRRS